MQILRRYVLHLLFTPAPSPSISANSEAAAPPRNPFPFQHRTNTLDRDRIVVPAGWDSWGKIAVLREGFDAKSWGDAWERDVDMDATDTSTQGAKALYSSLVPDQGTKVYFFIVLHRNHSNLDAVNLMQPPALPPFNNPTPEQIFLAKHYDEKAKRTDPQDDPRRAFNNPTSASGRGSASSPLISSPSPTGHTQHEVLQHFFQSLLSSKDRSGTANTIKTTMSPPPPSNGSGINGDDIS